MLSVGTLTTNVTGHFAFFSRAFINEDFSKAILYLWFLLSFLAGAFFSNLISEITLRTKENLWYVAPLIVEIILLISVASLTITHPDIIACILLFAMGLQNALVTKVSQSVVRTTHLTGLFTDLGIELSQLFFYKRSIEKISLKRSIYLKLSIIIFFFAGGIIGGFGYHHLELKVLFIAVACLLIALLYDYIVLRFYLLKRKVTHKH